MSFTAKELLLVSAVAILLCVTLPAQAASGPATIIDVSVTGCDPAHPGAARATLHGLLTTAGYTVTDVTTGVVPGSLSGQEQVWDIRCVIALIPAETTTYTSYLAGGGSLFLIGENTGYGATRNPSLISYLAALGAGSLTLTSTTNGQLVQPPFTGPDPVTNVAFRAIAGTTTPGTGSFITTDTNGYGGAIVFPPGTLAAAPSGTLMIVWDVNFLDNDAAHTAEETKLANNMIAYLAAPGPLGEAVPVLSGWALILLACALASLTLFALRSRRQLA
jgi:hypothetical protein